MTYTNLDPRKLIDMHNYQYLDISYKIKDETKYQTLVLRYKKKLVEKYEIMYAFFILFYFYSLKIILLGKYNDFQGLIYLNDINLFCIHPITITNL